METREHIDRFLMSLSPASTFENFGKILVGELEHSPEALRAVKTFHEALQTIELDPSVIKSFEPVGAALNLEFPDAPNKAYAVMLATIYIKAKDSLTTIPSLKLSAEKIAAASNYYSELLKADRKFPNELLKEIIERIRIEPDFGKRIKAGAAELRDKRPVWKAISEETRGWKLLCLIAGQEFAPIVCLVLLIALTLVWVSTKK